VDRTPKLSSLYVNFSSWVKDLAPIASLKLHYLGLWGCTEIVDFTPLGGLRELRFLDLEGTKIRDLEPIGQLVKLETLWLRDCVNVENLMPLATLHNLRRLYIKGIAPAIDLAPLAMNKNIRVYIDRAQEVLNKEMLGRRVHGL
jgi:Leucine-rich repeat (LRR) protein